MKSKLYLGLIIGFLCCANSAFSIEDMVVAADGTGDYYTISEAIESLPYYNYERIEIFIKNGVYNEKIRLEHNYLTIRGESRDSTIIQYAQLREDWQKNKDHIGPAVINIHADDIILDQLTIRNTQPEVGPHAFAIFGLGTRTIITNCNVMSNGGDTLSLWNYKHGMYYHDNCYFEGAVDFVCPRGWCYISHSIFKELKNTAAIWHAGPSHVDQKFVLKNCQFAGVDSFYLARHHYDAQFFFLDCTFPALLKDKAIEHVVYQDRPEKNRPYLYGDRYYFDNCKRITGNYTWFTNNLEDAAITKEQITPAWSFNHQWNPLDTSSLIVKSVEHEHKSLFFLFDEAVMTEGELIIRLASGKNLSYYGGNGWKRLEMRGESELTSEDCNCEWEVISGNVKTIKATLQPRYLNNHK
ncbi:pectinesterase family protein [Carboxylicivirga sp. N1Y90]|uniref:pectinesterase family protein n=1 Tax=Carboxylicivirga fragile TaxID=3417571 RepID=UPI003D34C3ED|nr:hypothetical protein [Marinilabiliaceae bacterium N1Y90]